MQERHWYTAFMGLLVLGTITLPVWAQDAELEAARVDAGGVAAPFRPAAISHQGGFAAKLEKSLGLTPEQKDAVKGLLAQQHQQVVALRQETSPKYQSLIAETDSKIRALLNPEQQKKFDTVVAQQKAERAKKHHHSKHSEE